MLKRLYVDSTDLMDLKTGVLKGLSSPPKETERPTYEVVSEIERYDGRDQVYSRHLLFPERPEYADYYSRHPEKKEGDDRRRQQSVEVGKRLQKEEPIGQYLSLSGFYGSLALSRPDVVQANTRMRISPIDFVESRRIEADPKEMTMTLKGLGMHMGAARVRITRLNQNWVYGLNGPPQYGKPVELNYQYIVCMAFPMDPFMTGGGASQSVDYEVGFKYAYGSFASTIMANFIRRLNWPARPLPTFNAPYLVPPTFIDAGIGEDGRCGYVVTKEFGNSFRPGAVATDLPLAPDKPVDFGLQDFCDKCKICAEACPSGAISKKGREVVRGVRRWRINAEKCFNYWIAKGSTCGVCQAVCPWNHPNNAFHNGIREIASGFPSLRNLLIKGERMVYGGFKPNPNPRWMDLCRKF